MLQNDDIITPYNSYNVWKICLYSQENELITKYFIVRFLVLLNKKIISPKFYCQLTILSIIYKKVFQRNEKKHSYMLSDVSSIIERISAHELCNFYSYYYYLILFLNIWEFLFFSIFLKHSFGLYCYLSPEINGSIVILLVKCYESYIEPIQHWSSIHYYWKFVKSEENLWMVTLKSEITFLLLKKISNFYCNLSPERSMEK